MSTEQLEDCLRVIELASADVPSRVPVSTIAMIDEMNRRSAAWLKNLDASRFEKIR